MTHTPQSAQTPASAQWLRWVIVAGALAVIGLVSLLFINERGVFSTQSPDELGGNFTLQSVNGAVSLDDFKGQVVLMYFGFLKCPDVCPASMGIYQQTLNKLSSEELDQVQPLLISIDPERDNLQALETFSTFYHPKIIGLTGSSDEVRAVATQYGAYFKEVPSDDEYLEYVFDHTSRYYVIDKQGNIADAMRHSTTANELTARIRTLL